MPDNLVSIIVPVYNVAPYIKKCLQSILDQTYPNFEVIVVDDGSPDNSLQIVEAFTDPRIKTYSKPNGGLSDARNFGLQRCRGDFVCFVDSDDWVHPDYLSDMLQRVLETRADLVICGFSQENISPDEQLVSSIDYCPNQRTFKRGTDKLPMDDLYLSLLGYAWNKLYSRQLIEQAPTRFEVGTSLIEDILFNGSLLKTTQQVAFCERNLYYYANRQRPTLIKKYYPDAMDLKLRRIETLQGIFRVWNASDRQIEDLISRLTLDSLNFSLDNYFRFGPQDSFASQVKNVRQLFAQPQLQRNLRCSPESLSLSKRIRFGLARYRLAGLTAILYRIFKRRIHQ
jgi:glycosyltransferase involved in cell wall biosynthesis